MHPILLSTPWFNVYSYGLFIALAYSAGTAWTIYLAKQERLPVEAVFDMLLLQLIVGVLGSRLLYLAEMGLLFSGPVSFWEFEKGGLTFYGAVFSSLVFDLLFLRYKQIPFWRVMDCAGNGLLLGIAVGRLGCFSNGCCFGVPCSWPWGMVFPKVSSLALHPTQLYESLGTLLIFLFHQKFWRARSHHGQGAVLSLGLYAVFRFFVEFWRGDNPVYALGLTLSQWVSLGLLTFGAITWRVLARSADLQIRSRTISSASPEPEKEV